MAAPGVADWTAGLQNLLRCFSRAQLLAATLRGPDLEAHHREVVDGTEPFRNKPYHKYADYSGPWIENAWVEQLCCGPHDEALFGRFVPLFIQWVDLKMSPGGLPQELLTTLHSLLRRDVLYVTVVQHDDGVPLLADFPNVLIFSAGGVGHVPIPLLKQEVAVAAQRRPFGRERALLFFGNNVSRGKGPVRVRLKEALDGFLATHRVPLPLVHQFRGPRAQWLGKMGSARLVLAPRGHGRSSYSLYEALQSGCIPLYVWSDLPWLPYAELWERGDLGFHAPIDSLDSVLSDVLALGAEEMERRRKSILRHRGLFTRQGVISQILAFLSSDGQRGHLRCETDTPRRNEWGWRFPEDAEFAKGLVAFMLKESATSVVDLGSGDGFLARTLAAEAGLVVFGADGDPRTPVPEKFHSGGTAVFSQVNLTKPLPEDKLFYLGEFDWVLSLVVGEEVPPELERAFLTNLLRAASCEGLILAWGSCRSPFSTKVNCRHEQEVTDMFLRFGYARDPYSTALLRRQATLEWYKEVLVLRRFIPLVYNGPPRQTLNGYFTAFFQSGEWNSCQSDPSGAKLHCANGEIWKRGHVPGHDRDLRGTWSDGRGLQVEVGCYTIQGPDKSLYPAAIMDRCSDVGRFPAAEIGSASGASSGSQSTPSRARAPAPR